MININRIRNNIETFSFPRLSGTNKEKFAFEILKKKIEDLNLNSNIQDFSFSTFYSRIYPKIATLITFWLLLIFYLFVNWIFFVINIIFSFIILLILFFLTRKPENPTLGKKLKSQNIYIKIPSNLEKKYYKNNQITNNYVNHKKNIFLFSHIDSKGQSLPIKIRSIVLKIWILSLVCVSIIIIIKFITFSLLYFPIMRYFLILRYGGIRNFRDHCNLLFRIIGFFPLIINFITTFIILLNFTNNKSPGALDNASGISCVLEILNFYSVPERRLKNHNLWFVFTGAEECGTQGIRNFYQIIKNIDRNNSIMLNFDIIGTYPIIFSSISEKFILENFKDIFKNCKIPVKYYKKQPLVATMHSDGYFLYKKGFLGLEFGDICSFKHIHTKNDTIDKVRPQILEKLCIFITNLLKEIDNKIKLENS